MTELDMKSFDMLTPEEQRRLAVKALAWFCVMDSLNPYFGITNRTEVNTIKIILGKFK